MREAEPRLGRGSGSGGGERRRRGRAGDRDRPGQPDLLRHGELRAHLQRQPLTLTFLAAWTDTLHSRGYVSGVYSSSASGIADLGSKWGTSYSVPDDLWIANWNGVMSTVDPYVPDSAWNPHRRIHQYRGGHDETYGGVTINIDNNYVDGATVGSAVAGTVRPRPVGFLDRSARRRRARLRLTRLGLRPERCRPNRPRSAPTVGGPAGRRARGATSSARSPVPPRPDIAASAPQAGPDHGFDVSFPTVKSGAQPVCVYALNSGGGEDRLLGCKATTIPVAISLSHLKVKPGGVRIWIACHWPEGTRCPGQLTLRTRLKIALPHRRGTPPRIRAVTRSLGRRPFQLSGERAHPFTIPFSAGGRALLQERGRLETQLIAAIPGGRRVVALGVGRRPD